MLRLATDENFNGDIIRGLFRRKTDIDLIRVQDSGLTGADDPAILSWAADEKSRALVPRSEDHGQFRLAARTKGRAYARRGHRC